MDRDINAILMGRMKDVASDDEQAPLVTALVGSQNYGIATDVSDIDTQTIILPSKHSVIMGYRPKAYEVQYPYNEHNTVKDFREEVRLWRKSGINFVEVLFTDWFFVVQNNWCRNVWNELRQNRELIARYNPYRTIMSAFGMFQKNRRNVDYAAEKAIMDGKSLSTCLRLYDFIMKFVNGEPYLSCLHPNDTERLIYLKEGKGLAYHEAAKIVKAKHERLESMLARIDDNGINDEADEYLDDICNRVMEHYLGLLF